jgi:Ca2+-binding EF-hand superfamily protein
LLDRTEAEGIPTLSEQFATVDSDSDGKISLEEMRAHHLAMGGEWNEEEDKTSDADELRTTTTATSTTTTTTTSEDPDDSSTTSER